jgi:cation diffusion facilitator family transporter
MNVAWPARMVSSVLGPPTKECTGPASQRLRYRACQRCAKSIGAVNVVVNLFLTIIKGYLGIVGRSTALFADAIHSAADVISSVMLLFGLRVANRPADREYPYGYGKVEFLVAVVIYASLISAGVVIFWDAISSIVHREEINPSIVTLFGAILSAVINELMFRQSVCAGTQLASPSIVANAWEKRSDAFSSMAVFGGIAGAKLGFHFLDPLAAILVAVYIMKFSIEMLIQAFRGLMDSALAPEVVAGIRGSAEEVDGIRGVQAVRTRELGQRIWVDIDVEVDGALELGRVGQIKEEVKRAIRDYVDRSADIIVFLRPASS